MTYKGETVQAAPQPLLVLLAVGLAFGCSREEAPQASSAFTEITRQAGFTHRHQKPSLDPQIANIMDWMASVGAAVAAGDYDNDGWVDLYVTTSRKGELNYLYRNNGNGTFTDVASRAGLAALNGEEGTSMDAVWGDYDNDGWIDLYLVRWGRDALWRSNGKDADGHVTFTDVSADLFRRRDGEPGLDWANGNAAVFLDYDRDGRLDLYVGNYFKEHDLWHLETTRIMHDDFERSRNAGPNFLYHQRSDGTFTEVAAELGVDDTGWTLAVGSADLDGNGWPDLYSADDFGPDQLFLNRGAQDGAVTFDNASESALGYDTKKGMNVDFGDFNNDGWLDAYVTNITTAEYLQEGNMLWLNQGVDPEGELAMTDISLEAGTWDGGWAWGAKFFDYDNDTDLDIVSVNGFISGGERSYWYDLASWTVEGGDTTDTRNWPPIEGRSFSGYEHIRLFENDGFYSFTEVSGARGLTSTRDGRGVAAVDFDNDGDLDLYVANQGQEPNFYRNDGASGHYLSVALETDPTTATNRDGIGTRVTVLLEDRLLVRERDGGNSYAAQSDPRLHFGLGEAERAVLVEVRWSDGGIQYLEDVAADQLLTVRQDPSRYVDPQTFAVEVPGWTPPEDEVTPQPPQIDPQELDRQLAEMEGLLRSTKPFDRTLASTYRLRASTYGEHDRSIDFFQQLIEQHAKEGYDPSEARLDLSLAYVDKIPTCGGLAAVVCKGSLAKKGLDQATLVLADHPDSWLAFYSRGMNHLHWPRALRHSDDAARDLARCVELQEQEDEPKAYHLRTWLALGQAQTKAGHFDEGRETWRRGLEKFPGAGELEQALAIEDDDELLAYVRDVRSLERPVDTDVSFFEGEL